MKKNTSPAILILLAFFLYSAISCALPDLILTCAEASLTQDFCPDDPDKTEPGVCGCGLPDIDYDGDTVADCFIPKDMWSITCITEETQSADQACANIIDDDPVSYWNTQWNIVTPYPHWVILDLGEQYQIDEMIYTPRPNKSAGRINEYELYIGDPDTHWTFIDAGTLEDSIEDQSIALPRTAGRFIKIVIVSVHKVGAGYSSSIAELDVIGIGMPPTDDCPDDPDKIRPGACGCGVPDIDDDNDNVPNCVDPFPDDSTEWADSDGDGTGDNTDSCINDPNKVNPGICGCDVPDEDANGNGTLDCLEDSCPADPDKTEPGTCGCGLPDIDYDGDGTVDCFIPKDMWSISCITEETQSADQACANIIDDDPVSYWNTKWNIVTPYPHWVILDLGEQYQIDEMIYTPRPNKSAGRINEYELYIGDADTRWTFIDAGTLEDSVAVQSIALPRTAGRFIKIVIVSVHSVGSGYSSSIAELDVIGIPIPDNCPDDPDKYEPGICGCNIPDIDTDGDGAFNCHDICFDDPGKIDPGVCGCGLPDEDTNVNGIIDCLEDECPADPDKLEPGVCGCGTPDIDTDGDGTLDCNDFCFNDPNKINPEICGCNLPDEDANGNGTADCLEDSCPADPDKTEPGTCGCGVPDIDYDGDGMADCFIPKDAWSITCVSEETLLADQGCANIIDDDPASFWNTKWNVVTPYPHWVIIDLGEGFQIDEIIYTPRPNKSAGRIKEYELYIGDNDTEWNYITTGFLADSSEIQSIPIPRSAGRFIQILILSVHDRGTLTAGCIAELDVIGIADNSLSCPDDADKTTPGVCGCGVPDVDADCDNVPDCIDPFSGDSTEWVDSDGDGTGDNTDLCDNDPDKTNPSTCGCGVPDEDINGNGVADCFEYISSPLPKDSWSVTCISEEVQNADQACANIIDDDPVSYWNTQWRTVVPYPHWVIVDLGAEYQIEEIVYTPRPDKSAGRINAYELYIGDNDTEWNYITAGTLEDSTEVQSIVLPVTAGRFIQILILSVHDVGGDGYSGSIAELDVIGTGVDTTTNTGVDSLIVTNLTSRQVLQRNNMNMAIVPITGKVTGSSTRIEVRALPIAGYTGTATPWMLVDDTLENGQFAGTTNIMTGWYVLEIRGVSNDTQMIITEIDRVGIGDIYITTGQSNSANHGFPRQTPDDGRVSARTSLFSNTWQHAVDPQPIAGSDGGSPWPQLGDLLVNDNSIPVGFISVGVGGTEVAEWLPGSTLYDDRLKSAIISLANNGGFRAILWHQGEHDAGLKTPSFVYAAKLRKIITQSRLDAGLIVPWGVARASYSPNSSPLAMADIVAAQQAVIDGDEFVFEGPFTDDFHTLGYVYDSVHFNQQGLDEHAARWLTSITSHYDQVCQDNP